MIHGITALNELYNFSNLTELTLNNVSLKNLAGIKNCPYLSYVCFKNYSEGGTIEDYSEINELNNLVYLYLENTNEAQKNSVFEKIKNVDYTKLKYLGIYNSGNNIEDISILNELSQAIKESITYLYLYSNNISDLSPILDYINVYELRVNNNSSLETLKALEKMNNIKVINASYCNLGTTEIYNTEIENDGKNDETDSLACLKNKKILQLNLTNNENLKWIDYIKNSSGLEILHLGGCGNMVFNSVKEIVNIYIKIALVNKSINSKYNILFNTSNRIDYINMNYKNSSPEIELLYENTDVTSLRLDGNYLLTDNVSSSSERKLTDILKTCTKLEVLSLRYITGINNIDFVKYMPNLMELDLYGCSNISDLSLLEDNCKKLRSLKINNSNIDLTRIQKTISRCKGDLPNNTFQSAVWFYSGFVTDNPILAKKLENCTNLTSLYMKNGYVCTSESDVLDLSKCVNLLSIELCYMTFVGKVPSSLEELTLGKGASDFASDLTAGESITEITLKPEGVINSDWFPQFGKCTNLKTLTLGRIIGGKDMDLSNLSSCINLTSLMIVTMSTTGGDFSITGFNNVSETLNTLCVRGAKNFSDLTGFEKFVNLETLEITYCSLIDLIPISKLTRTYKYKFFK